MNSILDLWRRRRWRADSEAITGLGNTRPATIVTGGSEGIGLALAAELAQRRDTIILIARNASRLDEAKQQLAHAKADVFTIPLDLTSPNAIQSLQQEMQQRGLHVDELVNSAGLGLSGKFSAMSAADINQLLELNVAALTRLTHAALPDMLIRGRGGIINIASLGGLTPGPYQAAYYASKAYVISLTRALAHENRGMGLTFTCVAPGPVQTKFHAKMDADRAFYRLFLPALTATHIAKSTIFWYGTGRKVIIPGFFNIALALALRILPGALTIPVVAFLLNPGEDRRDV